MNFCCPYIYDLRTPLPSTKPTESPESREDKYASFDQPTCCDRLFNLFTASAPASPSWSLRNSLLKDIDLLPTDSQEGLSIQELLNISSSQL